MAEWLIETGIWLTKYVTLPTLLLVAAALLVWGWAR